MLELAAVLIALLGLAHSVLGERYLLTRLFKRDNLPPLFGGTAFTIGTLRFAWHLTTLAWWGLAALVLLALGVPQDLVMQDYLLTNGLYRRPAGLVSSAPEDVLNVIWRVQEDFLQAALQAVERDHGGLLPYLSGRLGVNDTARKRLAELYLQPPGGA